VSLLIKNSEIIPGMKTSVSFWGMTTLNKHLKKNVDSETRSLEISNLIETLRYKKLKLLSDAKKERIRAITLSVESDLTTLR